MENWTHLEFSPVLDLELSCFVHYFFVCFNTTFLCASIETYTNMNVEAMSSGLHCIASMFSLRCLRAKLISCKIYKAEMPETSPQAFLRLRHYETEI